MTIVTLDHLINEKLYNNIKKEFLEGDEKYRSLRSDGSDFDVDLNDDSITVFKEKKISTNKIKYRSADFDLEELVEVVDEVDEFEVDEVTLSFVSHLDTKIELLTEMYSDSFVRNFKSEKIYNGDAISNYCKMKLSELVIKIDNVKSASHLSQSIKDKITKSIEEIYEFVSNYFGAEYFEITQKIPLNLSKNQVVGLFRLLKQNDLILDKEIGASDLARLIEQYFTYYDAREKDYCKIKNARKLELQLFGEGLDKLPEKTISELQEIFQDNDFWALK
jgi:hypothetical protein